MFTSTAEPKSIPANYRGQHFRSRLEVRWAVFFDVLGIAWHYEPETFDLQGPDGLVRYLPDFWLPQQECYAEIKPGSPNEIEALKASLLARHTGRPVFVLARRPGHDTFGGYSQDGFSLSHTHHRFLPDGSHATLFAWCVCKVCGAYGLTSQGRCDALPCGHCIGDYGSTYQYPQITTAYEQANRWSFY
jgi:hypothetical protein